MCVAIVICGDYFIGFWIGGRRGRKGEGRGEEGGWPETDDVSLIAILLSTSGTFPHRVFDSAPYFSSTWRCILQWTRVPPARKSVDDSSLKWDYRTLQSADSGLNSRSSSSNCTCNEAYHNLDASSNRYLPYLEMSDLPVDVPFLHLGESPRLQRFSVIGVDLHDSICRHTSNTPFIQHNLALDHLCFNDSISVGC